MLCIYLILAKIYCYMGINSRFFYWFKILTRKLFLNENGINKNIYNNYNFVIFRIIVLYNSTWYIHKIHTLIMTEPLYTKHWNLTILKPKIDILITDWDWKKSFYNFKTNKSNINLTNHELTHKQQNVLNKG